MRHNDNCRATVTVAPPSDPNFHFNHSETASFVYDFLLQMSSSSAFISRFFLIGEAFKICFLKNFINRINVLYFTEEINDLSYQTDIKFHCFNAKDISKLLQKTK